MTLSSYRQLYTAQLYAEVIATRIGSFGNVESCAAFKMRSSMGGQQRLVAEYELS